VKPVPGRITDRSQEGKILALLRARNAWVSAVELTGISLQYCARINGLRKRGFVIENRLEVSDSGRRRGFYRLYEDAQPKLFNQSEMLIAWRDPEEEQRR
jgi:hypothetical protein